LTEFVIQWGKFLQANKLLLSVWIGGDTIYDIRQLYETSVNIRLVTMQTYTSSYDSFISQANNELIRINNISRLDFGLLTDTISISLMSGPDIERIVDWLNVTGNRQLSIWASHISPTWYGGLKRFVSG
jgi:hypothetical protein